jgi:serine protease Do
MLMKFVTSKRLFFLLFALFLMIPQLALCLTPDQVYEKVRDSVVVVKSYDQKGKLVGFGSGVVIPSGDVVTNYHVIARGSRYEISRAGKTNAATKKIYNRDNDLALLSAQCLVATPVFLGQANGLKVGERVYAVGSPEMLELSISEGIVSQLRGGVPPLIQTTAAISPGSSGGGLFNAEGELVGITTFKWRGENLNFALPVEWIWQITQIKGPLPSIKPVNPEAKHRVSKNRIFAENGNIFISYDNGTQKQLTFTNKDSNPYFSEESKKVVFLREIDPHISSAEGDIIFTIMPLTLRR